ncbi:MAG: hypothetical protein ABI619_10535 [Betaproteobacteria bacterium]
MNDTDAPPATAAYDSVGYQQALSQAVASIKTVIQRRQLDPLRYIVEIDAGLPIFATRDTHQLRIAYNRFRDLSMEVTIPHRWMLEQTGKGHEDFLLAVDDMVLELKGRIQAAGRPI